MVVEAVVHRDIARICARSRSGQDLERDVLLVPVPAEIACVLRRIRMGTVICILSIKRQPDI